MAQRSTSQAKTKPPSEASSTHLRSQVIEVLGAKEHNLKNINLVIPRNKLVVITGPSGSGKSSLAFDTLFAEGQRRYIESLSTYARQFVEQLKKPEVDSIRGLCPSIAIQQKGVLRNPRSTVGTLTEIYDFMRLLYARIGHALCPHCKTPITSQSITQIADQVFKLPEGTRVNIMGVIVRKKKGEFAAELDQLAKSGIVRARIDGRDIALERGLKLEKQKPHTIEAYIDRLIIKTGAEGRVLDALALASSVSDGQVLVEDIEKNKQYNFNESLSCASCGFSFPEITPRLFSFNSPIGACATCRGLGILISTEEDADEEPNEDEEVATVTQACHECDGKRLKLEARSVFVNNCSIDTLVDKSIKDLVDFIANLKFSGNEAIVAEKILREIKERLQFLLEVGLHYLTLSRRGSTLSGGEEQRVHLATQIGTQLTGILYVLDEPSIGLHQADNEKLIGALKKLRDKKNTVIVVEHDLDTMRAADYIIDLGPGAGRLGGSVVEEGVPNDLKKGITGQFLKGTREIPVPKDRRKSAEEFLKISNATLHNLKSIDVKIPLGVFTVFTGVSGSGKSTLVLDVIAESLKQIINSKTPVQPVGAKSISGNKAIERLIRVDQSPIGRSPRSNPATYIGVFGIIRDLFSQTILSRQRGYAPGRFSFNVKGGRCEACQGAGVLAVEMHFLADVSVTCETCGGKRYNPETLQVTFKGKNIHEILEMSFDDAAEFFEAVPSLASRLQVMKDIGLGYLKLGQSALTLSGGEAQRIKLSKELAKRGIGKTLYIFDEPTTGLHFVDVEKLLFVINRLVDGGSTVVTIEHHLDVIKSADYVIDLGPGGGAEGGQIVAEGTPEDVARSTQSQTGRFLSELFS